MKQTLIPLPVLAMCKSYVEDYLLFISTHEGTFLCTSTLTKALMKVKCMSNTVADGRTEQKSSDTWREAAGVRCGRCLDVP